ncbi:MAG: SDR family oxidoreductase [Actinobacteria bacterium]|nr:SDR family oxidoreductase [Actinomycetota bacterium]
MRILVFGASGLLGPVLCSRLELRGHEVLRFARDSGNPCGDEAQITCSFARALQQSEPDGVINLVAATNVDRCERDKSYAALLNCFVPQVLSSLCQRRSANLIHISSDQVYGGLGPHGEESTCPINVYALTKRVGEYPVLQSGGCVLRTNFFGRSRTPGRSSLSDWLVEGGRTGTPLNVFDDVWFSPLGIKSLSDAIARAMETRLVGLYNLGAANGMNKAAFAHALFAQLGLDRELLRPVSVANAELTAPRPNDMRMNSSRFAHASVYALPTIEEEIDHEAADYL